MPPDIATYGPWGATLVAVVVVVTQYLQGRDRTKELEKKVAELEQRATTAEAKVKEWERKEAVCQQSLLDSDRRLLEKERQSLGYLIEIRDMQAKVIELQRELERRPKRRGA